MRETLTHARIQKVLSEGVQFFFSIFSWWGLEDPNAAINGQPSARQRNII